MFKDIQASITKVFIMTRSIVTFSAFPTPAQEYVSKVAKTETDACALIDASFEYVCDYEGHKIFRKRKY